MSVEAVVGMDKQENGCGAEKGVLSDYGVVTDLIENVERYGRLNGYLADYFRQELGLIPEEELDTAEYFKWLKEEEEIMFDRYGGSGADIELTAEVQAKLAADGIKGLLFSANMMQLTDLGEVHLFSIERGFTDHLAMKEDGFQIIEAADGELDWQKMARQLNKAGKGKTKSNGGRKANQRVMPWNPGLRGLPANQFKDVDFDDDGKLGLNEYVIPGGDGRNHAANFADLSSGESGGKFVGDILHFDDVLDGSELPVIFADLNENGFVNGVATDEVESVANTGVDGGDDSQESGTEVKPRIVVKAKDFWPGLSGDNTQRLAFKLEDMLLSGGVEWEVAKHNKRPTEAVVKLTGRDRSVCVISEKNFRNAVGDQELDLESLLHNMSSRLYVDIDGADTPVVSRFVRITQEQLNASTLLSDLMSWLVNQDRTRDSQAPWGSFMVSPDFDASQGIYKMKPANRPKQPVVYFSRSTLLESIGFEILNNEASAVSSWISPRGLVIDASMSDERFIEILNELQIAYNAKEFSPQFELIK